MPNTTASNFLKFASADGQTDIDDAHRLLEAGDVAGVLVPSVNRFGIVEDLSGFAEAAHAPEGAADGLCRPSALAVVRTPGEWGADVACGDAQTLGIPLGFGGLMWVFWHAARSTCATAGTHRRSDDRCRR